MTYYPKIKNTKNGVIISNLGRFSLADTLDCGQAFRWQLSGSRWSCIIENRYISAEQLSDESFIIYNQTADDVIAFWGDYFDIYRDYGSIMQKISANSIVKQSVDFCGGIRILKQPEWETLCSFIISQNNNIPRIKGIIERLCTEFGEETAFGFTFPSAERLAMLTTDDLSPIRAGFRAKYIIDAAQKVASREVDFEKIKNLPLDDAREELKKIKGVGNKVADCALLFGFGKTKAFPQDVWIKRAMDKLFGGVLPSEAEEYAGIAQQIIFHYARTTKLDI